MALKMLVILPPTTANPDTVVTGPAVVDNPVMANPVMVVASPAVVAVIVVRGDISIPYFLQFNLQPVLPTQVLVVATITTTIAVDAHGRPCDVPPLTIPMNVSVVP